MSEKKEAKCIIEMKINRAIFINYNSIEKEELIASFRMKLLNHPMGDFIGEGISLVFLPNNKDSERPHLRFKVESSKEREEVERLTKPIMNEFSDFYLEVMNNLSKSCDFILLCTKPNCCTSFFNTVYEKVFVMEPIEILTA